MAVELSRETPEGPERQLRPFTTAGQIRTERKSMARVAAFPLVEHSDTRQGNEALPGVGARAEPAGRATRPAWAVGASRSRWARSAPLGTSRTEFHPPLTAAERKAAREAEEKRQTAREWRRLRYSRRQRSSDLLISHARQEKGKDAHVDSITADSSEWVRPPRPARCRWRCDELVTVHGDESGAHWGGLERCASIWACPVCSSVIRSERAIEVQDAVNWWQGKEQGGSVVFVTLTLRHKRHDLLETSLDAAIESWRGLLQGKAWGTFKERFGVQHYIRAIEVTYGKNGWHPHVHALFFTSKPLSKQGAKEMSTRLYQRWSSLVVKNGGRTPTELRGVDVRPADKNGTVVAQYLGKMQDSHETHDGESVKPRRQIGKEIARFDFKSGRGKSVMPFELLDGHALDERLEDDEYRATPGALWIEYVEATHGRRAITWSRGLKGLAGLDDKDDEEVIEDAERAGVRFAIRGDDYDRHIKNEPAVATTVLDLIEDDAVDAARELARGEWVVETVDPETGELRHEIPDMVPNQPGGEVQPSASEQITACSDPATIRARFERNRAESICTDVRCTPEAHADYWKPVKSATAAHRWCWRYMREQGGTFEEAKSVLIRLMRERAGVSLER